MKTLVEAEIEQGIPLNRIILMGFSQGGCTSVYTGLQQQFLPTPAANEETLKDRLAGIVVLSGYLPNVEKFSLDSNRVESTPILHCHGDRDNVIPIHLAHEGRDYLLSSGVKSYTLKQYSGVGHSISTEILLDVANFIRKCLAIPQDSPQDL